jgi:hypothetical protein
VFAPTARGVGLTVKNDETFTPFISLIRQKQNLISTRKLLI